MIDKKSGQLMIESIPLRPGRRLSRIEFLSLPIGKSAKIIVKNKPFCSYNVGKHEISGPVFIITIYFHNELLESLSLTSVDDKSGESWADWSREKEWEKKEIHDRWLNQMLGKSSSRYNGEKCGQAMISKQGLAPLKFDIHGQVNL